MTVRLFGAVQNYPQMLRKIAVFTFLSSCLAVYVLRHQFDVVGKSLAPYSNKIPFLDFSVPLGTFVPAFVVALVFRICKLHDRLSDLFGIRQRFDTEYILRPLAAQSGVTPEKVDSPKIAKARRDLMSKTFYKYASSTPERSTIDTHYVTMALDQWSWFWIILESLTVASIVGIMLLITWKWIALLWVLGFMLVAGLLLWPIWRGCKVYAKQEVDQILADAKRKAEIAEVFDAL